MTDAHEPDELRRQAAEILDRPEFGEPAESVMDRIFSWIGDRVNDLISGLAAGDVGSIIVLILVVGIVVALMLFVRHRLGATIEADAAGIDREVRRTELRPSPEQWAQRAAQARERGDWDEAVRCEHRRVAAVLDHRGLVRERDHRTAGELLGDVDDRPRVSEPFRDLTRSFQDIWYGGQRSDERLAQAVREVGDEVAVEAEAAGGSRRRGSGVR